MASRAVKAARKKIAAANARVKRRFAETMMIALSLFLALTYSNMIQNLVNLYIPIDEGNIGLRLLLVAGLTYAVVLAIIALEKFKK